MAAPIFHLRSTDSKESSSGVPRLDRGTLEKLTASVALPGGGSASVDTGPTASGVPSTGWAITAGSSTGYASCRVRAVFSGTGTGADGYFTVASNGTLSGLTVTSQGSGYIGTVTAAPYCCPLASVVFDLGTDWHQYTTGQIAFAGLPSNDTVLRFSVTGGREATASEFLCIGYGMNSASISGAWFSPVGGGSPTGLIRLGARFIKVDVVLGMTTQGLSIPTAVSLIAFPN